MLDLNDAIQGLTSLLECSSFQFDHDDDDVAGVDYVYPDANSVVLTLTNGQKFRLAVTEIS